MRFKPRTDLERVYDSIIKQDFTRENDKNIIEKQLKDLELNFTKNPVLPQESDVEEFDYNKTNTRKELTLRKFSEEFTMDKNKEKKRESNIPKPIKKTVKRKENLNNQAKNLMKDLHNKTHFKGASVIAYQPSKINVYKK